MTRRKDRVPVVLDTNVIVRALADRRRASPSTRTYRLWLQRRLQVLVSDELQEEYLEVLERLGMREGLIRGFAARLRERSTVTYVRPGFRLRVCRDPDDDVLLDIAQAGRARYLITNDKDLLEIPESSRKALGFEIVSPADFLDRLETSKQ